MSSHRYLRATTALGALCLAAGCPSSSTDDPAASYDVIPLGSLNGFGFDRNDTVGQGTSMLNNQRQIVGVRKAETAGAPARSTPTTAASAASTAPARW